MDQLQAVLAIVLIDLALSGDNALLIGMAARSLPRGQRLTAIALGGALAVALRVVFTVIATLLLAIPYLQLVAGAALVVIAYRLVRPQEDARGQAAGPAATLRGAIATIVVADAAMSLENVIGVAGAAHGDLPLLVFALALSIPIVLFGSRAVVRLLERWPALIWAGAVALVLTAGDLILEDPLIGAHLPDHWLIDAGFAAALLLLIALARRVERRAMVRR